jgi:hypothetical protein
VSQEEELTVSIRVALHESHGQWHGRAENAPGIEVYGSNKHEVLLKAKALALRIVADRTESEIPPRPVSSHPCDKFA